MKNITINRAGVEVSIAELQDDVNATIKKGLSFEFAWTFTAATVQALIHKVVEMASQDVYTLCWNESRGAARWQIIGHYTNLQEAQEAHKRYLELAPVNKELEYIVFRKPLNTELNDMDSVITYRI